LGHATNNEAEFMAVKQGILIAIRENYHRIIVEGDSAMVTGVIQKLQQGNPWEKITQSWRIAALMEEVSQLLKQVQYLLPSHIKRKGNAATDFLANWGCQNTERFIDACPRQAIWDVELHSLQLIVNKDLQPPDRGEQLANRTNRGRLTARHPSDS
jgi:ribonuclease HI